MRELGIPTYITRSEDETLERDERVNRILSAFGNDPNVIVLSNHINAGGGEGAEVVYALRNSDALASSVLNSIGNAGQKVRKYYQRRLPSDPSKDYYFIQRLTGNTQPLLIEYGFIDNPNDLNKLKNDLLKYGEAVVKAVAEYSNVPYIAPGGISSNVYTVSKGDTLYSIAERFNTTVSELKSINNLSSNLLNIGQKLVIPGNNTDDNNFESGYYIVEKGDSLYSISKKTGVSIDKIIEANNLTSTVLQIGDRLVIPGSNTISPDVPNDKYIVQKGDSLYSISKMFGVTVDELKRLNNLSSNLLSIGQELIIRNNDFSPNNTYVVQRGDSLYSISRKFNVPISEIKKLNNLSSDLLSIGQVLLIPA